MNKLTTVIPTRNRVHLLRFTLQSLAAQTRKPDRVVVLDNGSTDSTPELLKEFSARLPIEHRPSERFLTWIENHNRGIALAPETCYLHFLHDDDMVLPDFYATLLKELDTVTGKAMAFCPCQFIDAEGKTIGQDEPVPGARFSVEEFLRERLYITPIYVPAVILRTNNQPSHCQFRDDFRQTADMILWSEWAARCDAIFRCPKPLALYRMHSTTVTGGNAVEEGVQIDEEWRMVNEIARISSENSTRRVGWLEWQKLKCMICARAYVMAAGDSVLRREADWGQRGRHLRKKFGMICWLMGKTAAQYRRSTLKRTANTNVNLSD